jgi:hypothetical protein
MLEMLVVANICGNGSAVMYEMGKAQSKAVYKQGVDDWTSVEGGIQMNAFICFFVVYLMMSY